MGPGCYQRDNETPAHMIVYGEAAPRISNDPGKENICYDERFADG